MADRSHFKRIRGHRHEFHEPEKACDVISGHIQDASYVLLGEATHGTHEFYLARAVISKMLITQKNFRVIALEADWPSA